MGTTATCAMLTLSMGMEVQLLRREGLEPRTTSLSSDRVGRCGDMMHYLTILLVLQTILLRIGWDCTAV